MFGWYVSLRTCEYDIMGMPARYEEIKNMTVEQRIEYPYLELVRKWREHVETKHDAKPEEYGDDVVGWHKIHAPNCFYAEGLLNLPWKE